MLSRAPAKAESFHRLLFEATGSQGVRKVAEFCPQDASNAGRPLGRAACLEQIVLEALACRGCQLQRSLQPQEPSNRVWGSRTAEFRRTFFTSSPAVQVLGSLLESERQHLANTVRWLTALSRAEG
ncbi:unnamed protein product [Symbiodinium natans]|uniref:Uncharacterized protein n=1 Tax=Symbiodinium natans TaxID=878477 RepID=A0A812KL62_9DINO|nr:unnamed protein product [Symbiodinium natans]